MLKMSNLKDLADKNLKEVKADCEITLSSYFHGTTRFAESQIHQNMDVLENDCIVRIVKDKKIGISGTTFGDEQKIKNCIKRAEEIAKFSYEDKDFVKLPDEKGIEYDEEIKEMSPEERAEAVSKIFDVARKYDLCCAGVIHTISGRKVIANTLGLRSAGAEAYVTGTITMMTENSSGYAIFGAKNLNEIDFEKEAEISAQKAMLSSNPKDFKPGKYVVLLEEPAVAEILVFLSHLGFSARDFEEGRSFMCDKIGKKITGDNVTIYDDVNHPLQIGLKFDREGVPKQKVTLIENGVAKSVVYDSYYAYKSGKKPTGHCAWQRYPYPMNLVMKGGETKREDLIKKIDEGILITRTWYCRVVDPDKTLITGMTRDGTFYIKNGEIKYGIKNMRFTINILETFKNIIAVSREQKAIVSEYGGVYVVPALLIKDFNFESATHY